MEWKEFRRLDGNAVMHGVTILRLMENAGRELARAAIALGPPPYVFVCGKGNNGGDGYAAASFMGDAFCVEVEPPVGPESKYFEKNAKRTNWDVKPGTIIDCVLGSGLQDGPRGAAAEAIEWINQQSAPVLSCDVPSGHGTSLAARSDHVLSFHAAKDGVEAEVVDIGIPPEAAEQIGPGDWDVARPKRGPHKGKNGKLLVVGGGPFVGAPYYAAMGGYRVGCDLVRVFVPGRGEEVQAFGPEPMVETLPGDKFEPRHVETLPLDWADAIVVGPGLGLGVQEAVEALCHAFEGPMVLDADAIGANVDRENIVFTPHKKERGRLQATKGVIVETGAIDVVEAPNRLHRTCHLGHPGMTVGGTGDVLAGAIAGLMAQGVEPYDAACAGLYLVNIAGEAAGAIHGNGLLPTDVLWQVGQQANA